jgi:hypothetical protein
MNDKLRNAILRVFPLERNTNNLTSDERVLYNILYDNKSGCFPLESLLDASQKLWPMERTTFDMTWKEKAIFDAQMEVHKMLLPDFNRRGARAKNKKYTWENWREA